MGNFNRDNNRFSKPSFSSSRGGGGGFKRRDFNDRPSRGPVEMHDAVCDNCGKNCQVPFRPTSGKPVFCSECFEQKNGGSDSRRSEGRNFSRPSYEPRNEGGSRDQSQPQSQSQFKEQLDTLNQKLDHVLRILESATVAAEETTVPSEEEQAPVAPKKKRASKATPVTEEVSTAPAETAIEESAPQE